MFQLDLEWVLLASGFVGLIVVGAFIIVRLKRWQAGQQGPTVPTRVEDYRVLMEQGLLEPREFERIREQLEKPSGSPPPTAPPDGPSPHPKGEG